MVINGVKIENNILINIDRNAEKIVIPECDVTEIAHGMTLNGINCMEFDKLSTLIAFVGVPKKVILNDERRFYPNDASTCLYDVKNELRLLFYRPGLEWLELTEKNESYKTIDGILYSKDGKTLLRCPMGRTGEVKIPEGTKKIDKYAFKECRISSVVFPDSLNDIGEKAFAECKNLKHIDCGRGIKILGNKRNTHIFQSCKSLEKIEFPSQLQSIGDYTFWNCNLKKVSLNEGLYDIGDRAFSANPKLKEIKFPNSLTSIGRDNFTHNVEDFYVHQIPIGFVINVAPLLYDMSYDDYNKKPCTVAIHTEEDGVIYAPKTSLSSAAKERCIYILRNHVKEDYANMFTLTRWIPAKQDTALYAYLYSSYSNADIEWYLEKNANEISERLLKSGRIKPLIDFLKTGFLQLDGLKNLLDMLKEDSEMNNKTKELGLSIDRQESVVRAYIMQAINEARKKETTKDGESMFEV